MGKSKRVSTWTRSAVCVAVAATAVAAGTTTSASANPAPAGPHLANAALAAPHIAAAPLADPVQPADDTVLEMPPPLPPRASAITTGGAGIATTIRATKAKLTMRLPVTYSVVYIQPAYRANFDLEPVPSVWQPTSPKSGCLYSQSRIPTDIYATSRRSGVPFSKTLATPVDQFRGGQFSPATVSVLAFGAIPVTATMNLTQPFQDGKLQPLKADMTLPLSHTAGSVSGGCDPAWEASVPGLFTSVRGAAEIRISNVKVDGQPVDVGPACRSVEPTELNLWGAPGYIPVIGGDIFQQEDHSPVIRPDGSSGYALHPDSTNLSIPAFTGCRSASGDDISRMITAMVSSDDNTAAAQQSYVITDPVHNPDLTSPTVGFDPEWPRDCSASMPGTCPEPNSYLPAPKPGKSEPWTN